MSQMRARLPLVMLAALIGASAALGAARATVIVTAAHNTKLSASIVVNQGGMTLYHLTAEKGTRIACTGACASIWPPLIVPHGAKLQAGKGVTMSKLGTLKRPDGRIQVTYAGLALYRYSGDQKVGDVKGEGFQHVWYAISPSGQLVKGGSGGGYGGGGGYGRG